jgi:dipeptidyl aminopeptidase/acylaminoacyl peptidase
MSERSKLSNRNNRNLAALFTAISLRCIFAPCAMAEARKAVPLPVESVVKARYFGEFTPITFSPDGDRLAYTVRENQRNSFQTSQDFYRTGVPWYSEGADIRVVRVSTGEEENLTGGVGNNWLPTWSPDGRFLAFLSDRDGSGQAKLWIWEVLKHSLRKLFDSGVRADQIAWMPDSRRLLVTTLPLGLTPEEYVAGLSSRGPSMKSETARIPRSTLTVFRSENKQPGSEEPSQSDPWNLERTLRDLIMVEVASGRSTVLVHHRRIAVYLLSPDSSKIAYTTPARFEKPGSQQTLFDLVLVALQTSGERVLASGFRLDYDGAAFNWSPDGSYLSFHAGGTEERAFDCYVVDLTGSRPRNLTLFPSSGPALYKASLPLWDNKGHIYLVRDGVLWRASVDGQRAVEIGKIPNHEIRQMVPNFRNLMWIEDEGKSTVVLARDRSRYQDAFYRIDLASGESTRLSSEGQCLTCAIQDRFTTVSADSRYVAYFAEDAQHAPDVWLSDSSFRSPRQITRLNPQYDQYQMGAARLIDWLSADGERLQGTLLLAAGYREGTRYPLIVYPNGGRTLSDRYGYFGTAGRGPFNMQLLATRGYALLLPDAPLHLGTPMVDLAKSVLPGVNKVIEMGIADPTRVGIMGQSNGGYSTLSLIVQTTRFKAAIELDGFGNLIGMYGGMDSQGAAFGTSLERVFDAIGGTPWEYRDRYIENSPVFYLERVETPLLIVQGENDTFVPPFLADEVFVGLRRLGKEVEYAKYHNSGHDPEVWSYENQLDLCNRMVTWFDTHLK